MTLPELQLSIHDLVNPTETAEILLETLSTEQLNIIENALSKIKQRKLNNASSKPNDTHLTQPIEKHTFIDKKPTKPTIDTTTNTISKPPNQHNNSPFLSSHEPTTELKEGVEWVSFVYSHHRTLRRYCIRTDLDKVDTNLLDDKFKKENCVYPRANLPRETYMGNRWTYETECNVLGWKLAYLNFDEIAGKRGLIQRAVDSYRNRYPSMRSRRVARQEKLLKGTLRKRKHRELSEVKTTDQKLPKTILIEDACTKCRIRINIDSVVLDAVDTAFRKNNCVFPRSINITSNTPSVSQRRIDEAKCNEIGWKLAWLNPRQLSNKKNLLQRALDIYRNQFAPELKPRKFSSRQPPQLPAISSNNANETDSSSDIDVDSDSSSQKIPLTKETLAAQQKELLELGLGGSFHKRRDSTSEQSCYSGTTVTLDFHDYCFSPPPEEMMDVDEPSDTNNDAPLFNEFINNTNNSSNSSTSSSISTSDSSSNSDGTSYQNPQPLLADIYQQAALLMNHQQTDLFTNQQQNMVDLIAKYNNVNAGIDTINNSTASANNNNSNINNNNTDLSLLF